MLSRNDHEGIVSRLYASALGEMPWAATLEHVAKVFRSKAALFQLSDPDQRVLKVENFGYSAEFAAEFYASEIYAKDPRMPHFLKVPAGSIYYDHMLFDPDEIARNRWCRESIDVLQVRYQLGAVLRLPDDATVAFTMLRSDREGHASEAAIRSFRRLMPYIEQACNLGHVMEGEAATRATLLEALACKADGVMLLDRAGMPSFMNDAARNILNAGDGLAFSQGAFVTPRPPETRRLQQLVGETLASSHRPDAAPGGHTLVSRLSGKPAYIVHIMAAPPTERFLSSHSIGCVVHLRDLAAIRLPSHEALRAVFGLTDREADLAIDLVRCADLERAATSAGMAVNTARNHLQSIFRKTATSGQTQLVQLLGRLP